MLFKPAIYRKYCKRCKFVASVGRPKAKKPSASRWLRPLTPHRGLCLLNLHWDLRAQTPVIGSSSRARHVRPQMKFLDPPPAGPTFNLTKATPMDVSYYSWTLCVRQKFIFTLRISCTWGNKFKLMKQFSRVNCRVFSFPNGYIDAWNSLSDDVICASPAPVFKRRLKRFYFWRVTVLLVSFSYPKAKGIPIYQTHRPNVVLTVLL